MGAFQVMTVERMSQGLVVLGELPSTVREGVTDVSAALNSLLLLLGFPLGLGWTAPDSRPNNFSFPLVFLQPSPLVYMLA